jgi:hypothetical protein
VLDRIKFGFVVTAAVVACSIALPAAAQTRGQNDRARRQAAEITPTEALQRSQIQVTAAGTNCQVIEAKLLGRNAEQQPLFEAVCESGPGYIVLDANPPVAQNCLELAAAAEAAARNNPEAPATMQCSTPLNLDAVRGVTPLAQQAGITCQVDAGRVVGVAPEGIVYEIGCAGKDGYRLEMATTGNRVQSCLMIASPTACRFTTPDEQTSEFQAKLAGTSASACQVQQVLYMGGNANGQFYETKCASGEGYVARIDAQGVAAMIYPCAEATQIGDGCTLTRVPAPAATAAPAE